MHKKMLKKEIFQQKKRTFRSHSDTIYQNYRPTIVEWMTQVGEICKLKNLTVHSAIGFVDMLLDITPVDVSRLQLVAITSILISAKIEEQEDRVPRVQTLTGFSAYSFPKDPEVPRELVLRMESLILNTLKWEVNIITTVNFLEYYLQVALYPAELVRNVHLKQSFEHTRAYLCKTAEFFADLSEHYYQFREYLPSVVGAASIAAARHLLRIQPMWTDALQYASSHSLEDISDCTTDLLGIYHQIFPTQ